MAEAVEATPGAPGDAALIGAVRRGDTAAYGVLYERHLGAARRAAAALANTTAEREDLVAEAFTRVLRVLRAGHGPDESFRAYLLTTMRNALITDIRRGGDVALCADVPETWPAADPVLNRVEAGVAADAFATLPERWRTVLWHTEIEGESPSEIAPLLGLAPNSVSALAYRAREGLRQAYLRQHLPRVTRPDCRAITGQLSIWVRRGCPRHTMRRISRHLDRCGECRTLAGGLVKVNEELRATVGAAMLGGALAAAYLTGGAARVGTGAAGRPASWVMALKAVLAAAAVVVATGLTAHPVPEPAGVIEPGLPPASEEVGGPARPVTTPAAPPPPERLAERAPEPAVRADPPAPKPAPRATKAAPAAPKPSRSAAQPGPLADRRSDRDTAGDCLLDIAVDHGFPWKVSDMGALLAELGR